MDRSNYNVLIVDDEELIRSLVAGLISRLGFSYGTAVDGMDALEKMTQETFDAVITDIRMPRMDGIVLTRELSNQYPGLPIMVMTAFDAIDSAKAAFSVGAREFVKKPFSISEFASKLRKLISYSEPKKQLQIEKKKEEDVEDLVKDLEAALNKQHDS